MKTLLALEPRILFDGAALATGAEVVQDQIAQDQALPQHDTSADAASFSDGLTETDDFHAALSTIAAPSERREIIFIDTRVDDYQTLLNGIDPGAEAVLLDPTRDGIEQIAEILGGRSNIDAIHLIAEGNAAELHLGTTFLTQEAISGRYASLFAQIGTSLTADADLLIYGCNFGQGEAGLSAMKTLAKLTGADIAASTDRTGHVNEYGNWELEVSTGFIETAIVIGEATQAAWEGVLATFTVTTTADGGPGSLRQAIIDANANPGTDTITFVGSGTYLLTIAGTGENAAATGDLDITDDLIIIGNGVGNTIIDGGGIDHVFEVRGGVVVDFENMTIRGGSAPTWGGGLYVSDSGNNVRLTDVMFTSNAANSGGGIYNFQSTLTATDSTIDGNMATSWGAGLYNDRGTVILDRVTVSNNSAGTDGGGINNFGNGASLTLTNVTISNNAAMGGSGGGLWSNQSVNAVNVTIANNSASGGGAGFFGQGGLSDLILKNSIFNNPLGANSNKTLTSLGNNIDSDGTAGLGDPLDGMDPLLGALTDNGGPTKTHALLAGSPAIDAGANLNAPAVDGRGFHRVDGRTDIGAFEAASAQLDKIYWVDQSNDKIQRANLDGSTIEDVLTSANGVNNPTEILIDAVNGKMYWSEYFSGNIKRANLDGTNIEILYSGLSSPAGMAFDTANNMLYWTENPLFAGTNQIRRADMDGGGPIDNLVTTGTNDPVDLQLDLEAGKIYWTDGDAGEIRRADLDGSNAAVFLSGLTRPQGLVLDRGARMMYWASDGLVTNKIQRANLDGAPVVQDLVTTGLTSPIGIELDLSAGKIYWSDWGTNKIQQANLDGTNVTDIVTTGLILPIGIAMGASVTNIAPTLDLDADNSSGATGNDYAFTFTEGDGPTAIADSDTDLADVDSTMFDHVRLTVSGLLDGNAEVLVLDGDTFALATAVAGQDTSGGNYHVVIGTGTGTATLTITRQGGGLFTEMETETLITAIQYQHTDTSAPTDGDRLIDVRVNDGTTDSAPARTTINVNPVNDQPLFSGLDNTPTFIEGGVAVVLDTNATIADPELDAANNYNGATLTLVRNGGANGEDLFAGSGTLNPMPQNSSLIVSGTNIGTVTTNSAGTLVLTFNGNATTALVNSTLQQITYANSSDTPPANVQIDFTFNDGNAGGQGSGGALNDTGSITVTINAVNDPPVQASIEGTALAYTENEGAVAITSTIAISDLDDTHLESALVQITGNYTNGQDLLSFTTQNGISGSWNATTGELTLSGSATLAQYEAALRSITYTNTSDNPSTATRTVSFTVNDGDANSNTQTRDITITAVNDPPVAMADTFTVNEGSTNTLNLAGNDTDADDGLDLTSITIISGPTNGTITSINPDGTVVYTHDGSETLADSFTYTIRDLAGATSNTVTVSLTVTPVNDAPIITSDGGGPSANVSVTEGSRTVTDVNATDAEGATLTYSIIGGADAALFNIDPATGVLTFSTAPDFQAPGDVGADNVYDVIVQVSDGILVDTQAIAVTVIQATVPPPIFNPPPPEPSPTSDAPPNESDPGADTDTRVEGTPGGEIPFGGNPLGPLSGGPHGATEKATRDPDVMPTKDMNERRDRDLKAQVAGQSSLDVLSDMLEKLQGSFDQTTFTGEIRSLLARAEFLDDLDHLRDAFNNVMTTEKTYVASGVAAASALSIGYVIWLLRSGVLLTALLSSVPAWQFVNPLLILATPAKKKRQQGADGQENDSLESMFENHTMSADTSEGKTKPKHTAPRFRWPWRTSL